MRLARPLPTLILFLDLPMEFRLHQEVGVEPFLVHEVARNRRVHLRTRENPAEVLDDLVCRHAVDEQQVTNLLHAHTRTRDQRAPTPTVGSPLDERIRASQRCRRHRKIVAEST